jgi:hypothetical protein
MTHDKALQIAIGCIDAKRKALRDRAMAGEPGDFVNLMDRHDEAEAQLRLLRTAINTIMTGENRERELADG